MMRKTTGNMMNNLEDPLYDPIQVYKNENKTKQKYEMQGKLSDECRK